MLKTLCSKIKKIAQNIASHDNGLIFIHENPVSWMLLLQQAIALVLYYH